MTGAANVASGVAVVFRELALKIAQRLDGEELLQIGARPMSEGEPSALVADVRRLREEVGWSTKIGLDEGLDDAIAWWRERVSGGSSCVWVM